MSRFSFGGVAALLLLAVYAPSLSAQSLTGVAAGDVDANSAVLWARTTVAGDLMFEYGTDPSFVAVDGSITVTVADSMIPAKVVIAGLSDNTRYYYRATDILDDQATGTFMTPAETGNVGFRMGVSGDWRGELAPYPAVRNAMNRNLDLWISLGDTIYADFASPAVPEPQAETLLDFRTKHLEVYSDRFGLNTLRDLRASTALLAMIDDHEVTNDFAGGADPQSDPRFANENVPFINETTLFQNGLTAFHEYNPIRDEVWTNTGEAVFDGKPKLFRARRYGQDAEVILVDARSFRDEELPEVENFTDLLEIFNFIVATFTPGRTMLGRPQFEEVKCELLAAQRDGVTWKFVIVPEPIQNLGFILAEDRFEGYAAERTELLEFINENDIDNVVFVAADIHGTVVNDIKYQYFAGGAQIPTRAFEITTGSVAFAPPFGPLSVGLAADFGLIGPNEFAAYLAMSPRDKDVYFDDLLNTQLGILTYEPTGLQGSLIDATLNVGNYTATHHYGWTEFDIDAQTQTLTITTYGLNWYDEAELLSDPAAIAARMPEVIHRFTVQPVAHITGDMNCDGAITVSDIGPFVQALTNPSQYHDVYPVCNIGNADINQDGAITVSDIGDFIGLITGNCFFAPAMAATMLFSMNRSRV